MHMFPMVKPGFRKSVHLDFFVSCVCPCAAPSLWLNNAELLHLDASESQIKTFSGEGSLVVKPKNSSYDM